MLLDRLVPDKAQARIGTRTLSSYLIKVARLGGYLARTGIRRRKHGHVARSLTAHATSPGRHGRTRRTALWVVGRFTGGLRGRPAARRRPGRGRHRAEHQLPERRQQGGLQFAIDAGRGGVRHRGRPPRDRPAAARQALAERRRHPADRPRDRGRRRRCAHRDQHAVRDRRGARSRRPLLGNIYGGLSGPAIKPVALRIVYEAAQAVKIPVVAIGGVTDLADVLDFLAVGAVAVQVGTAIFADPTLPVRLVDELEAECGRVGLTSYASLIGTALPKRPGAPSTKGVEYRP